MFLSIVFILLGFVLLLKGGDYLVEGAVSISRRARLSPMIIGMTVVGFGTSTPEFLVSMQAALVGSSGIALGNVVGSNIVNIAFILGITALICPLPSARATLRQDLPFLLFATALLPLVAQLGTIERWHGLVGLGLLAGYITWQIYNSRKQGGTDDGSALSAFRQYGPVAAVLVVLVALAAMVGGSHLLVQGATDLARRAGDSLGVAPAEMERIIGLTVVAVGTSLPELFASVMSARKGQTDIAVGNIIGSNFFNILCVVGGSAAISPIHGANVGFQTDYLVMIFVTLLLALFMTTGRRLVRWEASLLLIVYAAYIGSMLV